MGVFGDSLSAEDLAHNDAVAKKHSDHAESWELVPEGLLYRLWTMDRVNDFTYGPYAISAENRTRIEEYIDCESKIPCLLGEGCPEQCIPEGSMSAENLKALDIAVHLPEETSYGMEEGGIVVKQHTVEKQEADTIIHGPYAIKPEYRQQIEEFVNELGNHRFQTEEAHDKWVAENFDSCPGE